MRYIPEFVWVNPKYRLLITVTHMKGSEWVLIQTYRVDRILPQICTASAQVNMKNVQMQMQMQYRFAVINGSLSDTISV